MSPPERDRDRERNLAWRMRHSLHRSIPALAPTDRVAIAERFAAIGRFDAAASEYTAAAALVPRDADDKLAEAAKEIRRLLALVASLEDRITYHDSCHLKRTLKVFEQPRELLQRAGYELTEMFECDTCCGMGSYIAQQCTGR